MTRDLPPSTISRNVVTPAMIQKTVHQVDEHILQECIQSNAAFTHGPHSIHRILTEKLGIPFRSCTYTFHDQQLEVEQLRRELLSKGIPNLDCLSETDAHKVIIWVRYANCIVSDFTYGYGDLSQATIENILQGRNEQGEKEKVKYIALKKYNGVYNQSNGTEIGSLEDVRVLIRREGLAAVAARRGIPNDTWQELAKHLRVWAARSEAPLPIYVSTQDEEDESELEQPPQEQSESKAETQQQLPNASNSLQQQLRSQTQTDAISSEQAATTNPSRNVKRIRIIFESDVDDDESSTDPTGSISPPSENPRNAVQPFVNDSDRSTMHIESAQNSNVARLPMGSNGTAGKARNDASDEDSEARLESLIRKKKAKIRSLERQVEMAELEKKEACLQTKLEKLKKKPIEEEEMSDPSISGFISGSGEQEEDQEDRKPAALPMVSDAHYENAPNLSAHVSLCSAAIVAAEQACECIADLCEDLDAEE